MTKFSFEILSSKLEQMTWKVELISVTCPGQIDRFLSVGKALPPSTLVATYIFLSALSFNSYFYYQRLGTAPSHKEIPEQFVGGAMGLGNTAVCSFCPPHLQSFLYFSKRMKLISWTLLCYVWVHSYIIYF